MNKKTILIISHTPTHPPFAGNRACILSYANMLINKGYDVYFLWIAHFNCTEEEITLTQQYWKERLFFFKKNSLHRLKDAIYKYFRFKLTGYYNIDDWYPTGIQKTIDSIKGKVPLDAVVINYIFQSKLFKYFEDQKKILYTHDVFTDKFQKTGSTWFSVTAAQEAKALNRAEVILSIQEEESIYFRSLTNKPVLTSYSHFPIQLTEYIGGFNVLYLAGPNKYNIEAITWFVDKVLNKLIEKEPRTRLIIGGRICSSLSSFKNYSNIELYGDVENLDKFYCLGDVVINPTSNGTGLKIKTFEALSYSKVLICDPHSKAGIYDPDKCPVIIASSIEDYVESIYKVLTNESIARSYKELAFQYIKDLNREVEMTFDKALASKHDKH